MDTTFWMKILCHLFNFKILQTSSVQEKLSGMEGKPAAKLLGVTVLLFLCCRQVVPMLCPGMVVVVVVVFLLLSSHLPVLNSEYLGVEMDDVLITLLVRN
jgi:hypothetical protein